MSISKHITVATVLTMVRIVLVPWIVIAIMGKCWSWALILLSIAGISDLFDGMVARWLSQETEFGAYLDPIADKLLIIASYLSLLSIDHGWIQVPAWFVILVIARELIIITGAWYLGLACHVIAIRPTMLGKITTVVQLLLIIFLVLTHMFELRQVLLFEGLFMGACFCVLASLLQYIMLGLQGIALCRIRNM